MGKLGAVLASIVVGLGISLTVLEGRTVEGVLEWEGPCGRGEDGSRGVTVSGFQVTVRIEGGAGKPGIANLKPVFVPTRPDDPQGCGQYQVDLRAEYPGTFPMDIGDAGTIVGFQVRSIGSGGLSSRPAGCFQDRNCGCGEPVFLGDANRDSLVDISDAVCILSFLFSAECPQLCSNAADFNEDLKLDIADPVSLLNELFL